VNGPLRALFLDEGVLGHRTMTAQLRAALAGNPALEAQFETVPPPRRPERLLLRRLQPLGDADMFELRWRLRWSWRARHLLKRRAGSAEVALVTTQASALLMRGPMRRLPCVLSIDATVGQFRELDYGGHEGRRSRAQDRLLARLERRAIAGAAAIVAWTDWNAAALRREYDLAGVRIETIHPGLDADWWGRAMDERHERPGQPLRVLFVGNEVERKGLSTLIEAVERLDGEAQLDVVSSDRLPDLGGARVHRGVEAGSEALRRLYAEADVFALPTRADAVPWAVLEAMAAGLPVVASRVGAIEEMIGGGGEAIEPGDVGKLTAGLGRLTDPERRRRLGDRARQRVRERYDSAVQAPRLLSLLREAAGHPALTEEAGRISRRLLLGLGAGAAGAALAAPYVVLLADDEFRELVASKLGIEPKLAGQLLERARAEYGDIEYDARAAAFALAVRDPAAAVLPDGLRARAISSMIDPMLSVPAASLAYGVTGNDPGNPACAGLVRGR
jgi:glycosyltransferase involved in cell wall biosynthesis